MHPSIIISSWKHMISVCTYFLVANTFFQFQLFTTVRHRSSNWLLCKLFTARPRASAVYVVIMCPSVRLCVRHKPVLYRNDWTNRAGFWDRGFLSPIAHGVTITFGYLQNGALSSGTLSQTPELEKISSPQVDRVVNKTRRRRWRSSLLTTPIRQSTSRGCLLQVDQQ